MNILKTDLEGVLIIEPDVFRDDRGFFMETYHQAKYEAVGIKFNFIQDNLSYSVKGTLRGLHYQFPNPQAKLVQVIQGQVFDVAVDVRRGSATFGEWTGVYLSHQNKRQLYIPEGFAHGFCVLSETALFSYKCSHPYAPASERGILWSDPAIGVDWPVKSPLLSDKDNNLPCLRDLSSECLMMYEE